MHYGPNVLTNECDVLILECVLMTVLRKLATYAKQAKVIHFEIDPLKWTKRKNNGSCFS
jgi:acetolactate synthase-1/2/3 large subunit